MFNIFLPLVYNQDKLKELISLFINDPNQRRVNITLHPILSNVAICHAKDMADRNYYSHINPEGQTPNQLVRLAGYVLPNGYGNGNNIESINAGRKEPIEVWQSWLQSEGHRRHVLGESGFDEQTNYGMGWAYNDNSLYKYYCVLITAPPM